jgi:hypothetical protein
MFSSYSKYKKRAMGYAKAHPEYNAFIHALGGIAIGILITNPLVMPHPIRWAVIFGVASVLGHLYPLIAKK